MKTIIFDQDYQHFLWDSSPIDLDETSNGCFAHSIIEMFFRNERGGDSQKRKDYIFLLSQFDYFARLYRGSVKGFVDDQSQCAYIEVFLRFWEVSSEKEFTLGEVLQRKADYILYEPLQKDRLRILVRISASPSKRKRKNKRSCKNTRTAGL